LTKRGQTRDLFTEEEAPVPAEAAKEETPAEAPAPAKEEKNPHSKTSLATTTS
jgi:hypothetical protein